MASQEEELSDKQDKERIGIELNEFRDSLRLELGATVDKFFAH